MQKTRSPLALIFRTSGVRAATIWSERFLAERPAFGIIDLIAATRFRPRSGNDFRLAPASQSYQSRR